MTRRLLPVLVALLATPVVEAAEVVGTAYTVLLRGHGSRQSVQQPQQPQRIGIPGITTPVLRPVPQPRPQRQAAMPSATMRLVDTRSGQQVATASYDATIDGYMFRLPMKVDLSRGDVCLVIKNAAGVSIPVRDERGPDDGYAFRNPAWLAEVGRISELAGLRAEHTALVAELEKGAREIDTLVAENNGVGSVDQCVSGALQPDPPRPLGALEPAEVAVQAGPVCALAWERSFERISVDPSRLFADAGLAADWTARAAARPMAQALPPVKLELRDNDGRTIPDAASKGRAYLEHAEGVRALVRVHAACKNEVGRLAAREVQAWQNATTAARNAPARVKAACEQRLVRIDQLRAAQAKAPTYRRELERRITALDGAAPTGNEANRIDGVACSS